MIPPPLPPPRCGRRGVRVGWEGSLLVSLLVLVVSVANGFTPLPEGATGIRHQALHSPLSSPRFPDLLPISHWDGDDAAVPAAGADSRRRLWRWAVWRRLHQSAATAVLGSSSPSGVQQAVAASRFRKMLNTEVLESPPKFQFKSPDQGPVALATSPSLHTVHLITRAAAPEEKSLIYLNGTEIHALSHGYFRNPITLEVPEAGLVEPLVPPASSSAPVSLSLLGEFSLWKPAYLRVASPQPGSSLPSLYVSQFSLTGQGAVTRVDLFGSDKTSEDVKIRPLLHNFMWPNEVHDVKPGTIRGATEDSLLVADGFLMPGRSDGGLYVVQNPGHATEKVVKLTKHRTGWFYHKAVWVDVMGNGRPWVLTARATKPFFGRAEGELVLLEQPEGPFPTADWNLPWVEHVLVRGPDVMFEVTDLDQEDDTIEIFAAEFFSRRLTLHRLRRGSWKEKRLPHLVGSQVIDKNLGPAYSVVLADLRGEGRHTHVLVSSHECAYAPLDDPGGLAAQHPKTGSQAATSSLEEGSESQDSSSANIGSGTSKGGSLFSYEIPREWKHGGYRWRRRTIATGFQVRTWGQLNPGAPGFPYTFYPHKSMEQEKGRRPYILLAGDCSHAAYIFRPQGDDSDMQYELWAEINCGGTVGSLAVTHCPLFSQTGEKGGDDGWAKVFIPNFDANKVYVLRFGIEHSPLKLDEEALARKVPSEMLNWTQRRIEMTQEEDEVLERLASGKSSHKARADVIRVS